MNNPQLKAWLGSGILAGAMLALVLLLASPSVARPAERITAELLSGLSAERDDDLLTPVDTTKGVDVGAPVFFVEPDGEARPVAHVVAVDDGRLRVRFAAGEDPAGPWRVRVVPPKRGMMDAFHTAVPPETAERVGRELVRRLERLWDEELYPEVERNLPAFLDRIDPTKDTESSKLVKAMGSSVMQEVEPLLNELADAVARAVDRHFDLLDRVGLLWKVVRGDERGIKRQVMPVATKAATAWWSVNQARVLRAIARGLKSHVPEVSAWVKSELFDAAKDELLDPVYASKQDAIEDEGESLLRMAVEEVVRGPSGGLRIRFAAMLRATLLDKKTALVLIERPMADPN